MEKGRGRERGLQRIFSGGVRSPRGQGPVAQGGRTHGTRLCMYCTTNPNLVRGHLLINRCRGRGRGRGTARFAQDIERHREPSVTYPSALPSQSSVSTVAREHPEEWVRVGRIGVCGYGLRTMVIPGEFSSCMNSGTTFLEEGRDGLLSLKSGNTLHARCLDAVSLCWRESSSRIALYNILEQD